MKRAVIYARFSTDRQDRLTNEAQIAQCSQYAEEKGIKVVAIMQDEATSGTNFHSRPEVQAALAVFERGDADILICTSPDRLSRDVEHTEKILKSFQHNEWELHFAQSKGPLNALEIRLRAILSAEMVQDVRIKTREGQRAHFVKGKHVAGLPYGYRLGRNHDANGDRVRGEREIDPEQSAVVSFIFDSYIQNESPQAIADALNAQEIPGPRGEMWRDTTIRGHRKRGSGIINNEMYIGRIVYNRQRYSKDPVTEKRVGRYNSPSEWLTREDESLRIIDDERWFAVKSRQESLAHVLPAGAGNRLQGSQRAKYMFSGMISCGECGGRYSIIGKDRYGCSRHRDKLGCTNTKTISRIKLERRVNAAIPNALMSIDTIDELLSFVQRHREVAERDERKAEKERLRKLAKLEGELENLIAAIKAFGHSPSIQAEYMAAEAQKAALERPLPPTVDPRLGQVQTVSPKVLNAALRAYATHAVVSSAAGAATPLEKEWSLLVQALIDKIVVKPTADGEVLLEVHGQTPALLAAMKAWEAEERFVTETWVERFDSVNRPMLIAKGNERSEFLARLNEEIKKRKRSFERFQFGVVAGAGFEPATFRL